MLLISISETRELLFHLNQKSPTEGVSLKCWSLSRLTSGSASCNKILQYLYLWTEKNLGLTKLRKYILILKVRMLCTVELLLDLEQIRWLKKKKLYGPFLSMEFNCLKATELLRGGSLLFTTKLPDIPGTHLIDLRRMKGWVNLGATQCFWKQDLWIGNPAS